MGGSLRKDGNYTLPKSFNETFLKNEMINSIDENKFNDLIKLYKIVEVPKMMFIKFKHMYKFKFEISIKKFNDFEILNISIFLLF